MNVFKILYFVYYFSRYFLDRHTFTAVQLFYINNEEVDSVLTAYSVSGGMRGLISLSKKFNRQ